MTSSGLHGFLPFLPPRLLAAAYVDATETLEFADVGQRGWMDVRLSAEEHTVAFRTVSTVASRTDYAAGCSASFVQHATTPGTLRRLPCPPLAESAPPAHGPGHEAPLTPAASFGAVRASAAAWLALVDL